MNSSSANSRTAPHKQDENVTRNVTNSSSFKISLGAKQNDTSSRTSSSSADETVDKVTLEEKQKAERLRRQQEQQRLFRLKMEEKKRKMQQEQGGTAHGSHNSTHLARVEQGSSHNASHIPTAQQKSSHNASHAPTMQQKSSFSASSNVPAASSISTTKRTVQQQNAATSIGRFSSGITPLCNRFPSCI